MSHGSQPETMRAESEFRDRQKREDSDRIRKFVAQGMTRPEIMRRTGLSSNGVNNQLKRMGLSVKLSVPGGESSPAMGSQLAASRTSPHLASE